MFSTIEQVQAAKTADLVSFYNEYNPDKTVKKFSDRATAEKRVWAIVELHNSETFVDPKDSADEAARLSLEESEAEKDQQFAEAVASLQAEGDRAANESELEFSKPDAGVLALRSMTSQIAAIGNADANAVKKDSGLPGRSVRSSNAAGVAASWADPEVLAARLQRNGTLVTVDGTTSEFKSVRAAFRAYRLPDSKHIRFRLALKASKKETFENDGKKYVFTLVE